MYLKKIKILLLLFVLIFNCLERSYPIEIKNKNECLIDARGDDGDIIYNRISIDKKTSIQDLTLSAFTESQWNLDISDWEKLTLGIKLKKDFLKYLYINQSAQLISGKILDYMAFDTDSTSIDTTTGIGLKFPIRWGFSFDIFEEYSINLENLTAEYCESGARLIYTPKDMYSLSFGWRHIDRIHNLDTDYVTLGLDLHF
ncbi:MAG: hypothetical protein ABIG92_06155 [Candidatus Omnitrophota bacterium]